MSEYQHLLETYKMESEHPYNDGWSQLHYKEQYENLLKLGEKEFTTKMTNLKIEELEKLRRIPVAHEAWNLLQEEVYLTFLQRL